MTKRALIWNHQFVHLGANEEWGLPVKWIVEALQANDWEVLRHPEVRCRSQLDTTDDIHSADLVLYTHTSVAEVRGFTGPQWFLKSTAPSQYHMTLDTMGYGPFSSIAYEKPPFEVISSLEMEEFFNKSVPAWASSRTSKWGRSVFQEAEIRESDYILVVAQTLTDATVASMWFGHYLTALHNVIQTLAQVTDRQIVVKLHPWTDGYGKHNPSGQPTTINKQDVALELKEKFEALGPNIRVYSGPGSVHDFLPKAQCVVLCNSGAGLEALLHKKPIISWGYPEYHWVTHDLRHLCNLPRALDLDWFDEKKVAQFIYWYVERYCFNNAQSATRRVEELLTLIE